MANATASKSLISCSSQPGLRARGCERHRPRQVGIDQHVAIEQAGDGDHCGLHRLAEASGEIGQDRGQAGMLGTGIGAVAAQRRRPARCGFSQRKAGEGAANIGDDQAARKTAAGGVGGNRGRCCDGHAGLLGSIESPRFSGIGALCLARRRFRLAYMPSCSATCTPSTSTRSRCGRKPANNSGRVRSTSTSWPAICRSHDCTSENESGCPDAADAAPRLLGGALQQHRAGEPVAAEGDRRGAGHEADIHAGSFRWNGGAGSGLGGLQAVAGGRGEHRAIGLGGAYLNLVAAHRQVGRQRTAPGAAMRWPPVSGRSRAGCRPGRRPRSPPSGADRAG